MAHGDAREGKWRGNWREVWVASTLHTTSQHGVSSITTADAHTSAASSRLDWRLRRFKWTRPFRRKTNSGICACAITFQLASIKRWLRRLRVSLRSLHGNKSHTYCNNRWPVTMETQSLPADTHRQTHSTQWQGQSSENVNKTFTRWFSTDLFLRLRHCHTVPELQCAVHNASSWQGVVEPAPAQ